MKVQYATDIGTILHAFACKRIKYGFKLAANEKKLIALELLSNGIPSVVVSSLDLDMMFENLRAYVNDCIGYKMTPEVVLYFSDYCFGTTDAIRYSEKEKFLRIHDYKSGTIPAHIEQLLIYEALFCLEYRKKPYEFESELRIYQNCEVLCHNPKADEILPIIDKCMAFTKYLSREEED